MEKIPINSEKQSSFLISNQPQSLCFLRIVKKTTVRTISKIVISIFRQIWFFWLLHVCLLCKSTFFNEHLQLTFLFMKHTETEWRNSYFLEVFNKSATDLGRAGMNWIKKNHQPNMVPSNCNFIVTTTVINTSKHEAHFNRRFVFL